MMLVTSPGHTLPTDAIVMFGTSDKEQAHFMWV